MVKSPWHAAMLTCPLFPSICMKSNNNDVCCSAFMEQCTNMHKCSGNEKMSSPCRGNLKYFQNIQYLHTISGQQFNHQPLYVCASVETVIAILFMLTVLVKLDNR